MPTSAINNNPFFYCNNIVYRYSAEICLNKEGTISLIGCLYQKKVFTKTHPKKGKIQSEQTQVGEKTSLLIRISTERKQA